MVLIESRSNIYLYQVHLLVKLFTLLDRFLDILLSAP